MIHSLSSTQRGSSLLEILIAIVIVVIGLLGIARYNLETMRANQSAMQRSTATILSYSILDRMRSNRDSALAGDYDRSMPAVGASCDVEEGDTLVSRDIYAWITSLQNTLAPDACGSIDCDGDDNWCEISVRWEDNTATGEDEDNPNASATTTITTKGAL